MNPPLVHNSLPVSSRVVLTAGFGGLLLLMTFSGIDATQALEQIQQSNDTIRQAFLQRTRVLDRIRGDLYVSGTYVRDYLLEPESGRAEGNRFSLLETRRDMEAALAEYRAMIHNRETVPFQGLTRELDKSGECWSRCCAGRRSSGGKPDTPSSATTFFPGARPCWPLPTASAP